jgi:two-component SAPR family response regulator
MELLELGDIDVVGMYEDESIALEEVEKLKPDIVFLDINMPEIKGTSLFTQIKKVCPLTQIVFVTAYDEYAVEAFELNASDYIVKPIRKERLQKTIKRLKNSNKTEEKSSGNNKISIKCLGAFSIKMNGTVLNINWRTKKVEELIAYLACCRGEFIPKAKIAGVLWPDLETSKSKSNLYLTYHYLKKQSEQNGFDFPIESIKGKMRIKMEEVDIDIDRFIKDVENIGAINKENIHKAYEILRYYSEPLLDGQYYEWIREKEYSLTLLYDQLKNRINEFVS